MDTVLSILQSCNWDHSKASEQIKKITRDDLFEPTFSDTEKAKFEEAVSKYGSELTAVRKFVGTKSIGECVRYYYQWKKTPQGQIIWGNYEGRRHAGKAAISTSKDQEVKSSRAFTPKDEEVEEIARSSDDSAYDTEKATSVRKEFVCKFCGIHNSRRWARAPHSLVGIVPQADLRKNPNLVAALCQRCAGLWRHYGVQYKPIDDEPRRTVDGVIKTKKRTAEDVSSDLSEPDEILPKSTKRNKVDGAKSTAGRKRKVEGGILDEPRLSKTCSVCLNSNSTLSLRSCYICGLTVHSSISY